MNIADIIIRLQTIFDSVFLKRVIFTPSTDIKILQEWDWISDIYFVIAVQNEFGVDFRIGEAEATKNIGEFAQLILEKLRHETN